MQINISGQNVELTDALKSFIEEKFQKLDRHLNSITQVHVVLHVGKVDQTAEATVNTKGQQLFASSAGEDLYAAIDTLIDKLDKQAIKHKEKTQDHNGK